MSEKMLITSGIKICNPSDFLKGDYSCLKKDTQSGYYTQACGVFWNPVEVY